MGIFAKDTITLSAVNDAYSVLFSPNTCTIHANFDGSHPQLDNARSTLSIFMGDMAVEFEIIGVKLRDATNNIEWNEATRLNGSCLYDFGATQVDAKMLTGRQSASIKLNSLASGIQDGTIVVVVKIGDIVMEVEWGFTVIRETTMLDWILDWESNKTSIGDTYLITPKLFVGKKLRTETIADPYIGEGEQTYTINILPESLYGVYIGPDGFNGLNSHGIYGYRNGECVFYINEGGARLGGWDILAGGICSGRLQILSSGAIRSKDDLDVFWSINEDGSATFSKNNVRFSANGDAYFAGELNVGSGVVGGWAITGDELYSRSIGFDSRRQYIVVANTAGVLSSMEVEGQHWDIMCSNGGSALYYDSAIDYGMICYSDGTVVFQAGSRNHIAGWNFDNTAIYIGHKQNAYGQFTDNEFNGITIGTAGIRGKQWRLEADGSGAIAGGKISWTASGAVYLDASVSLGWSNVSGALGDNFGTAIDGKVIYTGTVRADKIEGGNIVGVTMMSGVVDESGDRLWILHSDGSGHIAAGAISWDSDGHVTFGADVTLTWASERLDALEEAVGNLQVASEGADAVLAAAKNYVDSQFSELYGSSLTHIGSTGIYTGEIAAEKINTGVMTAVTIRSALINDNTAERYWQLDKDGAGWLAKGNISWDKRGNVTFGETVMAQWGKGVDVAQIMAYSQMLYRDPEFYKGYNETIVYLQMRTVRWTVGDASDWIQEHGISLNGMGSVSHIFIDGNLVWSGSQTLSQENVNFVENCPVTSDSIVCVCFYDADTLISINVANGQNRVIYGSGASFPVTSCVNRSWLTQETVGFDVPNGSQKVMAFQNYGWYTPNDYRLGGFAFRTQSVANHKYLVRIVAKIPVGWKLENYHNAYGNQQGGDSKAEWLTLQLGTGEWKEYLYIMKCGSTGAFSTVHHFALVCDDVNYSIGKEGTTEIWLRRPGTPPNLFHPIHCEVPVRWYVAYATVYDATVSDKSNTYIDANGMYTGFICADNITAGTIKGSSIQNSEENPTWMLNQDGSGFLASQNIQWNAAGDASFLGIFKSENVVTRNVIEINAEEGHFIMYGPDFVRDDEQFLPDPNAAQIPLFSVKYWSDADRLARYCILDMNGQWQRITLGSHTPIRIENQIGDASTEYDMNGLSCVFDSEEARYGLATYGRIGFYGLRKDLRIEGTFPTLTDLLYWVGSVYVDDNGYLRVDGHKVDLR